MLLPAGQLRLPLTTLSGKGIEGIRVFALVRHAHAGDKKLWPGPDDQRPLSVRGRQQAEGLAENLRAMPVTAVLSSPYLRCRQTLAPLAARRGLRVADAELLRPEADIARLDAMLADPRSDGAVLCTHGETLSALLNRWRQQRVLRIPADDAGAQRKGSQKGATWIVETDGKLRTVHYIGPLHIGPALQGDAGSWPGAQAVRIG